MAKKPATPAPASKADIINGYLDEHGAEKKAKDFIADMKAAGKSEAEIEGLSKVFNNYKNTWKAKRGLVSSNTKKTSSKQLTLFELLEVKTALKEANAAESAPAAAKLIAELAAATKMDVGELLTVIDAIGKLQEG